MRSNLDIVKDLISMLHDIESKVSELRKLLKEHKGINEHYDIDNMSVSELLKLVNMLKEFLLD